MTDFVTRIRRGLALGANTDANAALDELCSALSRAVYLGMHLHAMVPREVWRDTGGDDQQGHYEGDYHAECVAAELRRLGDLVSVDVGWHERHANLASRSPLDVRTVPGPETRKAP